jgi:hypothetical protein
MRIRYSLIFTLSMFGVCATSFAAQVVPRVSGGTPVHCSDAAGAPVYGAANPTRGDVVRSTILPNGMRTIAINFERLAQSPPSLQLFAYAHECGRESSTGIVKGAYLHGTDFNMEKTADRIGMRLTRDELSVMADDVDRLSLVVMNNPPLPMYLPDLTRAQWIGDCYAIHNDACTPKDDGVSASGPVANNNNEPEGDKGSASGQPASGKLTLSEGLTQLVSAAQSHFEFVTYKCDFVELGCVSITFQYHGKTRSCNLVFQGGDVSFCTVSLASEKGGGRAKEEFGQAVEDVAQVLNGWSRKDYNLTGKDKAHVVLLGTDFTKDLDAKKSQQVSVRLERKGLGNFVVSLIVNAPKVIY